MFGAAADDLGGFDGRDVVAALHQLRIAVDAVERRADFVADADEIAALGGIGGFGGFLRLLQFRAGDVMGDHLLHQLLHMMLAFLHRGAAALVGEDDHPGDDPADEREEEEEAEHQAGHLRRNVRHPAADLPVDAAQQGSISDGDGGHDGDEMADRRMDIAGYALGQQPFEPARGLLRGAAVGFAAIMAARFQRAAERADRRGIHGAMRHIDRLEGIFADDAALGFRALGPVRAAGDIIAAMGEERDHRRGGEGDGHADDRRERLGQLPQQPQMRAA